MIPKDAPPSPLTKGGVVVGMKKEGDKEKIYFIGDDCHLLCVGATRSGKSRCLVLESICLLGLAGESIFCSDPKAELFQYTSEFLKKLGYEVLVLDFKNPAKSMRYNLLQPVIDAINEGDTDRAEMLAWDLTNNLVGKPEGEKIWTNGECSIIAAAILCVVCDNQKRPEFQNMTNVYWFISEMCRTIGNKMPLLEYLKKQSPTHPARALLSISDVAPSRTRGSFYTSALTTLRLFTSKSIYSITHASDFTLTDLGRKKQALFVILPDEKTTFYPIASLIVSQQYELLAEAADKRGGRLERRVNFLLDEFGNFTPISDMTNKLTVAAGRGMRYALYVHYTDSIDFGNRRGAELALHRYALINIDEFDSVKSSHQSFLKHILQKAVVNTRLPYQSASRNLRRYATFIATSNNYDLLTDPTGSRRFICVEVKGRIDYAQPIDYDQLYAEAKELLRRDERFGFTPEEEALITENNRDFQQQPAEEQLFLRYFKIAEDIEEAKPLLASEILDMIAEKQPGFNITKTMILNFGKLLKRNSVPNKRTMRGTCYYVEEVDG